MQGFLFMVMLGSLIHIVFLPISFHPRSEKRLDPKASVQFQVDGGGGYEERRQNRDKMFIGLRITGHD